MQRPLENPVTLNGNNQTVPESSSQTNQTQQNMGQGAKNNKGQNNQIQPQPQIEDEGSESENEDPIDLFSALKNQLNEDTTDQKHKNNVQYLSRAIAILMGTVGSSLGTPFEGSHKIENLQLEVQPDVNMLQGGKTYFMRPGQWLDNASQVHCWIMALLSGIKEKREREAQHKQNPAQYNEMGDEEFRKLASNLYARLQRQWYKHSFNSGMTKAQQDIMKKKTHGRTRAAGTASISQHPFMAWWEKIEKKFNTSKKNFLSKFDIKNQMREIPLKNPTKHGAFPQQIWRSTVIPGGVTAVFAPDVERAMVWGGYPASMTGSHPDDFPSSQLLAYLTFELLHTDGTPSERMEKLLNTNTFLSFLSTFEKLNPNFNLSDEIKALCLGGQKFNENKDHSWTDWRCDLNHYQEGQKNYFIQSLALVLNVISQTDNYEAALTRLAQTANQPSLTGMIASQLLGAIYGYEAIPQKWLDAVNQHPLTTENQYDTHTTELLQSIAPVPLEPNATNLNDLVQHTMTSIMPEVCKEICDHEVAKVEARQRWAEALLGSFSGDYDARANLDSDRLLVIKAGLWLLKDLYDPLSVDLKNRLVKKISSDIDYGCNVITRKELENIKFKDSFIDDFVAKRFRYQEEYFLFEDIMDLDINSLQKGEKNLVTLNTKLIYGELPEIILWKLYFRNDKSNLDENVKKQLNKLSTPTAAHAEQLLTYLSSLEYDTSKEANDFKCYALSFLLGNEWDGEKDLAKVIDENCISVINEQERYFILTEQMCLAQKEGDIYPYQKILKILNDRIKNASWPILTTLTPKEKKSISFQYLWDEKQGRGQAISTEKNIYDQDQKKNIDKKLAKDREQQANIVRQEFECYQFLTNVSKTTTVIPTPIEQLMLQDPRNSHRSQGLYVKNTHPDHFIPGPKKKNIPKVMPMKPHENGTIDLDDGAQDINQALIPIHGAGGFGKISIKRFEELLKSITRSPNLTLEPLGVTQAGGLKLAICNYNNQYFNSLGWVSSYDNTTLKKYHHITINCEEYIQHSDPSIMYGITCEHQGNEFTISSHKLIDSLTFKEKQTFKNNDQQVVKPAKPLIVDYDNDQGPFPMQDPDRRDNQESLELNLDPVEENPQLPNTQQPIQQITTQNLNGETPQPTGDQPNPKLTGGEFKPTQNILLFQCIKPINNYLKTRLNENKSTEDDFYLKRDSWMIILNQIINYQHTKNLDGLKKTILEQARHVKKGIITSKGLQTLLNIERYHRHLMGLYDMISSHPEQLQLTEESKARISTFIQFYTQANKVTDAAIAHYKGYTWVPEYVQKNSFFKQTKTGKKNAEIEEKVRLEKGLCEKAHQLLGPNDQDDFPDIRIKETRDNEYNKLSRRGR